MPNIISRNWTYDEFVEQADEAQRAEAMQIAERARQAAQRRQTGSPFRTAGTQALEGLRWLVDAENAMRRNVTFEDTSITQRRGMPDGFDDYLRNRKGVYQFIKDAPPHIDRGGAIRSYTAARALRLPSAGISHAARQYGAGELSRQACQTVRHFREDYREAMRMRSENDGKNITSTIQHGYTVVRWFENRKIEYRLTLPSPEAQRAESGELLVRSRVELWREVKEHFHQAIKRARDERRHANVDPLANKPTNFHLQKNAMKMLRAYKTPDASVRSVGIEIECFMPKTADMTKFWPVAQYVNVGSDGSIQGYPSGYRGVEFRVCAPAFQIAEVITKLCAILKDIGAKVNTSCGLHVHLDQRNKTPEQVQQVFANFIRAQNLLLEVVPKSRRENHFCKKHRGTDFQSAMYGQRYKIVNASAYRKHKTIEIRLFNGTVNAEKIINWTKTLWAIEGGQPVLRCPKTFDIAQRYWNIDATTLRWLKARQEKFKQAVTTDNTDVMDVEPIEEN